MRALTQGHLRCVDQATAQTMAGRLATKVGRMVAPETDVPPTVSLIRGVWSVTWTIHALTETQADQLHSYTVDQWLDGNQAGNILVGSWIKRTNNYDDEGQGVPDQILYIDTKA